MNRTLALALLLTLAALPALAADLPQAAKDLVAQGAAKHYDPAHPGHWHQCNRCGAKYHQQGDNGPGSYGSNVCPQCGFANPMPPSPTPYTPPTPTYPAPSYPTQPPYQPPYQPPSYGASADEILEIARRAYNYTEKDRILVDGSRRVNDGVGILKLWAEAWTDASRREILAAFSRGYLPNPPEYGTIVRFYDKCHNYNAADEMLVAVAPAVPSARTLFHLGAKFFNVAHFDRFAQRLEAAPLFADPPSLADMQKIHRDCHNYTIADRLLYASRVHFRAYTDLSRLAEIAFNPQVRRQLLDYAGQYGGGTYGSGHYPGPGYTPVGYPQGHVRGAVDATVATEIAAGTDDSGVDLDKAEIRASSLDRVAAFIARHKAGRIKRSPLAAQTVKMVREFLKGEALRGDSDNSGEAARLLEELEK